MVGLANKEDFEKILEMAEKHANSIELPFKKEDAANLIEKLIEGKTVLMHDSKEAMLAFLVVPSMLDHSHKTSMELSYWVSPSLRGQGVSNELISFYVDYCKHNKVDTISMTHMNDKYGEIAKHMYKKNNFKLTELTYKLEDN